MLAGSHRNAWPDETGTGGRTNRNTQSVKNNLDLDKSLLVLLCYQSYIGLIKVLI